MKRVAIVQSCYIPWKGYFDMVDLVDEFVLFDDRQFTRRDWRNRNRIKTAQGTQWLTIPVVVKGRFHQRIDETVISEADWGERHFKTLVHCYGDAPYLDMYRGRLAELYRTDELRLSQVNRLFIEAICGILGIETRLSWSTDYEPEGTKTERLISLCLQTGATHYLSGPSARQYLDESAFDAHGLVVEYADYRGYPPYPQLHPPFEHEVSVLDLLFHTGPEAPRYMKRTWDGCGTELSRTTNPG